MRVLMFLLFFLTLITQVSAETSETSAKVSLYVKNDPPVITSISLSPEAIYRDSIVRCTVAYVDELKENRVFYEWEVNGIYAGSQEAIDLESAGAKAGDSVECLAIAFDGAYNSTPASASSSVVQNSAASGFTKTVLGALGADVSLESLERQQGLGSITGFAVNEIAGSEQAKSSLGLLGLSMLAVMLLAVLSVQALFYFRKTLTTP